MFTLNKKKGGHKINYGGRGGLWLLLTSLCLVLVLIKTSGGGKCPEEEHTTCSGGPTINCHKRGLWGERKYLYFRKIKYKYL
jgi:hypothetical protein